LEEFRLGSRILQPHRQLLAGGDRVQLGRRALEIISVLAKARGQIVTKDELLEAVWPKITVEENALQVHVVALRKALGPEAERLKTIRGVGYRLEIDGDGAEASSPVGADEPEIANLLSEPSECGSDALEGRPNASPGLRRGAVSRRLVISAATLGLAALGAGVAAWNFEFFSPAPARTNSVAVMTFENLGGDANQDYFSAGLAEELRATLSLNPGLEVAARTSSDAFRDRGETVGTIARILNVAFVLEGSVRRSSGGLRVMARLIDGATGFESWSQVFERGAEDVIAVQREIAMHVADALTSTIAGDEAARAERIGGTSDSRAFDAYLQGIALYELAQSEATDRQALAAFEQAVEIDPAYAAAHAARSRALTVIGSSHGEGEGLQAYYEAAIEAARNAIDLAPGMAEGHAALGLVLTNGRLDMAAAGAPYRRSFDLGYGNANILRGFADFAAHIGLFDEAREAVSRAKRLDPLNFLVMRSQAIVEFSARNFRASASEVQAAIALNPRGSGLHRILGDIALLEGRDEEARRYFGEEPGVVSRLRGLAIADARLSGQRAGEAHFAELIHKYGRNSLYQQGQVLTQWGQREEALAALEQALDAGDPGLVLAYNDPLLDLVRQDARFRGILTRLGFEEARRLWRIE
jgi:TolB-like protein/DNA-binding winged helix-turn-helix (wHTH) protein/tetratricopeptide (TPR) repeat protein